MKKKLVTIVLTASMILGCLVGCGQSEQKSEESKGSESKVSSDAEAGKTTEVSKDAEKEEPIVTVKWCIAANEQKDLDKVVDEMNKILRERYRLELDLEIIATGEFNQRMQLMSTSNEDYDLVFTCNWLNKFGENVARDAFLPLNDLLESEAGTLLREALPEGLTNVGTVAGTIYAVPNYQLQYKQRGFYIRKALVDEFGLDVDSVKSIKDLEPFMEWIRDTKKDMWPIQAATTSSVNEWYICGTYDAFQSVAYVDVDDEDYKVHLFLDNEDVNENLKLVNDYFKRGFIRSDQASIMDETADGQAGRYAITVGSAVPGAAAQKFASAGEEYVMIEVGTPYKAYNAGAETMTAINANSKNPEAAIKMLGVMWTDVEIFNMMTFGLEGVHYNKVAENRVEQIADSGYTLADMAWSFGNQFNAYLLPGQQDDLWEVTEANNQAAPVSHLAGFTLDTSNLQTELAQLSTVRSEYGRGFIWAEDYEAWKSEYKEKLKAAGVDTVIKEVQRQIDEWRAANGK